MATAAPITYCGAYAMDGTGKYADAVIIPSLTTTAGVTSANENLCGQSFAAATTTSICSK